jgi:hypothetical protein
MRIAVSIIGFHIKLLSLDLEIYAWQQRVRIMFLNDGKLWYFHILQKQQKQIRLQRS